MTKEEFYARRKWLAENKVTICKPIITALSLGIAFFVIIMLYLILLFLL